MIAFAVLAWAYHFLRCYMQSSPQVSTSFAGHANYFDTDKLRNNAVMRLLAFDELQGQCTGSIQHVL